MDISWVEWEVVDRMKVILETPHPDFEVTHTYASLVPILCWALQKLRAEERDSESLISTFDKEPIVREPWSIAASELEISGGLVKQPEELSAKWFLIGLRNGVAHGDDCKVEPFSEGTEQNRKLIGFKIKCDASRKVEPRNTERPKTECVWRGKVTLRQSDMLHLGKQLADRFCKEMRGGRWQKREARGHLTEGRKAA